MLFCVKTMTTGLVVHYVTFEELRKIYTGRKWHSSKDEIVSLVLNGFVDSTANSEKLHANIIGTKIIFYCKYCGFYPEE